MNANHDDGFQSWSLGDNGVGTGVVYGMVLRGNTIINYEDKNQPFRGTLQGIGCFDGMFEDWRIENNVIITDHWHGITLSGATNCTIINNTVVDINDTTPGPPWIRIGDHKNGTQSTGCLVRNNLTTALNISSVGVVQDHNSIVRNHDDHFVNYRKNDLRLKAGCSAIDSGSAVSAPAFDRDKNPRPFGTGVDIGAYEWGYTGIIGGPVSPQAASAFSCLYYPRQKRVVIYLNDLEIRNVSVFDIRGRAVTSLVKVHRDKILWEAADIGSGLFILTARTRKGTYASPVFICH